jgi:cellulose biosynthesis protein BcsQ
MAKVVSAISGKGGGGKTTMAGNTAARLGPLGRGDRVLVVDADEQDGGSIEWYLRRNPDSGLQVTSYRPDASLSREKRDEEFTGLLRKLPTLDGFDWIIIDTIPILDSPVVKTVIEISDFLLLPTRMGAGDIARLVQTIKEVAIPSGKPFGVALTDVDPRAMREAELAVQALTGIGAPVLGIVRQYTTIRRAAAKGLLAGQFEGGGAANALADFEVVTAGIVAAFEGRAPTDGLAEVVG